MIQQKEIWILDSLPPGRPIEARGISIPFAFRGESLAFTSKEDADKWLADYGVGTGGRLWHLTTVPTEEPVEVKPEAEGALSDKLQSLIESRVAEILSRGGVKVPVSAEPVITVATESSATDTNEFFSSSNS